MIPTATSILSAIHPISSISANSRLAISRWTSSTSRSKNAGNIGAYLRGATRLPDLDPGRRRDHEGFGGRFHRRGGLVSTAEIGRRTLRDCDDPRPKLGDESPRARVRADVAH